MGVCNCSMFCCTLLYVHFSIAIILMGKRELIALLNLSSWCLVMVERLFLTVPRGCLHFVIVVFPDHTHLLFFIYSQHSILTYKTQAIKAILPTIQTKLAYEANAKKRVISNNIVTVLKSCGKRARADVNCFCKMTSVVALDGVTFFTLERCYIFM